MRTSYPIAVDGYKANVQLRRVFLSPCIVAYRLSLTSESAGLQMLLKCKFSDASLFEDITFAIGVAKGKLRHAVKKLHESPAKMH